MRIYRFVSAAISGILLTGTGIVASAGCGGPVCAAPRIAMPMVSPCALGAPVMPGVSCRPGTVSHPAMAAPASPVHVYNNTPYDYLRTSEYKQTPNVNITRVYSRAPAVTLQDAPIAFRGGCSPTSTAYCRSGSAIPAPVMPMLRPAPVAMPLPVTMYAPRPVRPVPVYAPRPIATNGGYWERVSGPTMVGGLPATQIVCRRAAPRPVMRPIRVVRPVIGVPIPVPTPVFVAPRAPACATPQQAHRGRWSY